MKIFKSIKGAIKSIAILVGWSQYKNFFYSQEGEDILLQRIFASKSKGFYVDVGAHHPMRFSNTYLLYKKGWHGINIDAMPGSMDIFKKMRPRDVNLEVGVANKVGSLNYYIFNEPALNGFSKELSMRYVESSVNYKINAIKEVQVLRLKDLLDKYVGAKIEINLLSVDAEGLDLEILESNDWLKYRPNYVLVEILDCGLEGLIQNPVAEFMNRHGYSIHAKLFNSALFKDNS